MITKQGAAMNDNAKLFTLVLGGEEYSSLTNSQIRQRAKYRAINDSIIHIGISGSKLLVRINRDEAIAWNENELILHIEECERPISLNDAIKEQQLNRTCVPPIAQQLADRRRQEEIEVEELISNYIKHIPSEVIGLLTQQHMSVLVKKYRASHGVDEYGFDASDETVWLRDAMEFSLLLFKHNKSLSRFGHAIGQCVIDAITQHVADYAGNCDDPQASPARAPIPKDVMDAVWRRDMGRCVQCGSQRNIEFDHIIAVSLGGANTYRNLQLLCQDCNRSKASKPPGH